MSNEGEFLSKLSENLSPAEDIFLRYRYGHIDGVIHFLPAVAALFEMTSSDAIHLEAEAIAKLSPDEISKLSER